MATWSKGVDEHIRKADEYLNKAEEALGECWEPDHAMVLTLVALSNAHVGLAELKMDSQVTNPVWAGSGGK